jgi:hypothetical protein
VSQLITLVCNRGGPDLIRTSWTAAWDGTSESGRTPGEAIDRILRMARPGDYDGLMIVFRQPPDSARGALELETKTAPCTEGSTRGDSASGSRSGLDEPRR